MSSPVTAAPIRFADRPASGSGPAGSFRLLLAFLFLLYANLPLLYPTLDSLRPAKIVAAATLLVFVGEALAGRRQAELAWPEGYLLLAFLAMAAVSCVTALWPGYAGEAFSDLIKMALVYFFLANCAGEIGRLRAVMWTMLIGGLFPAAGTLHHYLRGELEEGRATWIGIFGNPNEAAYGLVILIPIAAFLVTRASWTLRLALFAMVGIYLAAIFVTFSRGGLVGLGAVALLIGWRKRNVFLQGVLIAAMVAGLIYAGRHWSRTEGFSNLSGDMSFQQRIATLRVGLAVFADHPITGVGLGCSVVAWPLYAPKDLYSRGALVTHNTAIQPLAETGVFGFLAFGLFIGISIYSARALAVGSPPLADLAAALEIALWGFVVCGLSGGYVLTWFPYILTGLVSAARRVEAEH